MWNCRQESDFYLILDPWITLIRFDKSRAWFRTMLPKMQISYMCMNYVRATWQHSLIYYWKWSIDSIGIRVHSYLDRLSVSVEIKRSKLQGPLTNLKCQRWQIISGLAERPWLGVIHDDAIKWKHFPRYWPFVRWIYRWIPFSKASDAEPVIWDVIALIMASLSCNALFYWP